MSSACPRPQNRCRPRQATARAWVRWGWAFVSTVHGIIDHPLGDDVELLVVGLTHSPKHDKRLIGANPVLAADDADRLLDDRPAVQRAVQVVDPKVVCCLSPVTPRGLRLWL